MMVLRIYLLLITIMTISAISQFATPLQTKRIKLPGAAKKAFQKRDMYYLYRSIMTGQKRGLNKELKKKMLDLSIIHLLTPSGLHFSTIFLIFIMLRKRFKTSWLICAEAIICLLCYILIPGYFSLRRVALLRALFLLNKQTSFFNKNQIFTIFFIWEFFFGTCSDNKLSFCLSMMFLGLIFLGDKINFKILSYRFFIAQIIVGLCFKNDIYVMNLFFSPLITYSFTFIYPAIFLNIFMIKYFNYSEFILMFFNQAIDFSHTFITGLSSPMSLTFSITLILLYYDKRLILLFFVSYFVIY